MSREKFARLAEAHCDDDREECLRFRHVPDVERASHFAGLCRLAKAASEGKRYEQDPRSVAAEEWWFHLLSRERAKHHANDR